MEVPRHWRLKKQRYAMVGETCPHCKAHLFPPRPVCPQCGGSKEGFRMQKQELALVAEEAGAPVIR